MPKSKKFKDYIKFRSILLDNNIKDQGELAKFLGLSRSSVSVRFSNPKAWKLEEAIYMSKMFNRTIDDITSILEVPS